jgi:hypothetical protein
MSHYEDGTQYCAECIVTLRGEKTPINKETRAGYNLGFEEGKKFAEHQAEMRKTCTHPDSARIEDSCGECGMDFS